MANRDLDASERATLRLLVDSTNLQSVLMALSELCGEVAAETGQRDKVRRWQEAEGAIGVLVSDKHISAVS